jgi:glycosyltransferase involved in cell wall biosynthesis
MKTNMQEPLISVVIPAYNAARFISDTIRSVQAQTFSNWEMIIINDGSKDETFTIAKQFADADSRIHVFTQENAGVCITRNNGFQKAKGKYIALLDADDLMLSDNLQKKLDVLTKNEETKWVYSNLKLIDTNGNKYGPDTNGRGDDVLEHLLLWSGEVIPGPCSNLVFSADLIRDKIQFDPQFSTAADQDFCMRLAANYRFIFLSESLACYRILPNSMSRNIAVMEKDHIGVYTKAAGSGLFKTNAFRRKCFSNLYLILAGSWWVNGKNKMRGLYFVLKALFTYPPVIGKLIRKIF